MIIFGDREEQTVETEVQNIIKEQHWDPQELNIPSSDQISFNFSFAYLEQTYLM